MSVLVDVGMERDDISKVINGVGGEFEELIEF